MNAHRSFFCNLHSVSASTAIPARGLLGRRGPLSLAGCALAVVLLCPAGSGFAAPVSSAKPAAVATKQTKAPAEMEIPQSVFLIPASAREGRNPFFPGSAKPVEAAPKPTTGAPAVDTSSIVLNGITPRPTPTVMLNSITFEKGEEHEIKLKGGTKVRVKCEEIKDDSAVILVNGIRREVRLKGGL